MPKTAGLTKSLTRGLTQDLFKNPPATGFSNTYSMDFDGSDDYVLCYTGSDLNFIHTAATLAYWCRYDSTPTGLTSLGLNATGKKFRMGVYGSSYTWADCGSGSSYGSIAGGAIAGGEWHHYALVANGSTLKTFVDGQECSSNSYTPSSSNNPTNDFMIGASNSGSSTMSDPIDGQIDEVAIWSAALSSDALTQIYNSGVPTDLSQDVGNYSSSSSLYSWWRMGDNDGGSGSTVTDMGSGSNNGTVNGATFSSNLPS